VGITILVIIGCSVSFCWLFSWAASGLVYRLARGKPVFSVYDIEFISLNLRD